MFPTGQQQSTVSFESLAHVRIDCNTKSRGRDKREEEDWRAFFAV
jgi:hypothetical protein